MKKLVLIIALLMSFLTLTACKENHLFKTGDSSTSSAKKDEGKEITLDFAFGTRTGRYCGEMKDDIPHGKGKFTSTNSDGGNWTYEGEFKNGHFDGEGKTTWESSSIQTGKYKNDIIIPVKGTEAKKCYVYQRNIKDIVLR